MSKEFGVFSVNDAKEIKRRVLSSNRTSLPSVNSGEQLEDEYYAVLTEDLVAATDPLTGFTECVVRLLKYDDYSARSMRLVESDSGLLTVIHRYEGIEADRGSLVVVKKLKNEWCVRAIDCDASATLIAALDELE